MCTPLMAQRCLLHHAASATGFCLFLALLAGDEWDELIALGIAKDNSEGNVSDMFVFCMCTCPTSQWGAPLTQPKLQPVWGLKASPRFVKLKMAAPLFLWQRVQECLSLTDRGTDISGISAQLHKEILTPKSPFQWPHSSGSQCLTDYTIAREDEVFLVTETRHVNNAHLSGRICRWIFCVRILGRGYALVPKRQQSVERRRLPLSPLCTWIC